jgi:hypothetical protein
LGPCGRHGGCGPTVCGCVPTLNVRGHRP